MPCPDTVTVLWKERSQMNKKELQKELDKRWKVAVIKRWGLECFCSERASSPHHYIPKSRSTLLRYDVLNGVPLCRKHHYLIHFSHNPEEIRAISQEIRDRRGIAWQNFIDSMKGRIQKPTVGWLKEQLERLQC